jgi:GntR family transcriptional regulator
MSVHSYTHGGSPADAGGERAFALDRSSPLPLWAQLLADLRRRVAAGELAESFPGEIELATSYGVSRNTVREAMRRLRSDGTVVAGRGRRPRLGRTIRQPLGSLYSLFESVRAAGLSERDVVRRLALVHEAAVAGRLGLEGDAELVYVERLRLAGEEPLALDRIWLPAVAGRPMLGAELGERGFYDELARLCGIRPSGGEEHLRAVVPTPAQRRLLAMPASTACFAIERLARVGVEPVEWRETLVRGDRFSVLAEFSAPPQTGGADLLAAGTWPGAPPG